MLTFQNQQPDSMSVNERNLMYRHGMYEEIARQTHQPRVEDIMPHIAGIGKLSGLNLGVVKIPQASPGVLIGVGIPVAGLAGVAAWAIFDAFPGEKSTILKLGLFGGGVIAGAALLCALSAIIKGVAVATGLSVPDAAEITVQNPQTGQSATAVVQNPNVTPTPATQAA